MTTRHDIIRRITEALTPLYGHDEARSIRRNEYASQGSAVSRRKESSPESGAAPSVNHWSMTGSRLRWIWARRETPAVSAAM